ncbi:MAG TPA: ABC transporter ATP-binding protein [Mycobacteriales bacterium]|nr:ABC transporter ATP-binding protein [Mycobacteriales bacterium]
MTLTDIAPDAVAAKTDAPAVRVDGLVKRFGRGPLVLDGVSLEVSAGEFVCLLGASGCGKSTLLSLLAGLDRPTSGTVTVTGGRAGLMFQEPALLPWLTASRNVELALRLADGSARGARSWAARRERRAEALRLLAVVRLENAADKRPHELSGGMRQRVALARALAQRPRVLLMDEPFAALDAITRDVLHEELSRLWAETGVTVVFVTHNVREAVRLGERVLLMSSKPGRIVEEYVVDIDGERRIESPDVAALSIQITERLRAEIRRHA